MLEGHENNNREIHEKSSVSNKIKPLDRVKISGCQIMFPKSNSTDISIDSTSNSSTMCSQYLKELQQQKQSSPEIVNIDDSRFKSSGISAYRVSRLIKTTSNMSSKTTQNTISEQTSPSLLPITIPRAPSLIKKKQPSFIRNECSLATVEQLSDDEEVTTRFYTYAASSSSSMPDSMITKRNSSLLPIVLQSSCCMGVQTRDNQSQNVKYHLVDEQKENSYNNNNNDNINDGDHLLDYKYLINHLPKPIISIRSRHEQDDYGILFEQLHHIREMMPKSSIYDEYTRSM